jgi:hypothetical protein
MSKLLDYINTLDKNASALEAHSNDPKAAMENFGLTPDEQDAFLSGDKERVAELSGIDTFEYASPHVTHTTPDSTN